MARSGRRGDRVSGDSNSGSYNNQNNNRGTNLSSRRDGGQGSGNRSDNRGRNTSSQANRNAGRRRSRSKSLQRQRSRSLQRKREHVSGAGSDSKRQKKFSRSPTPVMDMSSDEKNNREGERDEVRDGFRERGRGRERERERDRGFSTHRSSSEEDREYSGRSRSRAEERKVRSTGGYGESSRRRSRSKSRTGQRKGRSRNDSDSDREGGVGQNQDREYRYSKKMFQQFNQEKQRERNDQEQEQEREEEERYQKQYQQFLQQYEDKRRGNKRSGSGIKPPFGKNDRPSRTLYIKGIPDDMNEEELDKIFKQFPGVQGCRVMRDKATGENRGFGFVDFETIEQAAVAMAACDSSTGLTEPSLQPQSKQSQLPRIPYPIQLEYSLSCTTVGGGADTQGISQGGIGAGGGVGGSRAGLMDWLCNMCGAVNFSRRLECYQCCAPRTKDAQRVIAEPEGPTSIIRVSGLEPSVSEEDLLQVISGLVQVKEVRLMKDRYTGYPRGFGFIHLNSVADSARVMNYFQGSNKQTLDSVSHLGRLSFVYAKDRIGANPPQQNPIANDALAAGQAMQNYELWQPKEYRQLEEGHGHITSTLAAQPPTTPAPTPTHPSTDVYTNQGGQFVYDSNSGYWYNQQSGCYYDANTGLYYDTNSQQWLQYDHDKGQYNQVAHEQSPEKVEQQQQQQLQQEVQQQQQLQKQQQQSVTLQQQQQLQPMQKNGYVEELTSYSEKWNVGQSVGAGMIAQSTSILDAFIKDGTGIMESDNLTQEQTIIDLKSSSKKGAVIGAAAQLNPEALQKQKEQNLLKQQIQAEVMARKFVQEAATVQGDTEMKNMEPTPPQQSNPSGTAKRVVQGVIRSKSYYNK